MVEVGPRQEEPNRNQVGSKWSGNQAWTTEEPRTTGAGNGGAAVVGAEKVEVVQLCKLSFSFTIICLGGGDAEVEGEEGDED